MIKQKLCLSVEDLRFSYGAAEVLHGMSFTIQEGDLLCLLGPNGSGKTTLFKCLLGLFKPGQGVVRIGGEDISHFSPAQLARKMAYIPQAHNPSFNYRVLDAVLMGRTAYLKNGQAPGAKDEKIALEALEKLHILSLKDKGYAHLSGGERQLVLIARAIAQQSPILVMDEPTSSLDYGNQITVLSEVKKLAQEGYIVIMSSHNPDHAFLYANQVLLMKKGQVVTMGDPYQVVDSQLLETIYGVPMDLINIHRGQCRPQRDYKICLPVL